MATSAHLRPPRVSGTRTPVRVLAVALVGLLAAGCSTQDYASTQESFDSTASTEQERSGDEGTGDQDVGTESAEGESDEGPGGEDLGANVQIEERHLVHTADMTVRVEDVDEATEQAKELTAASDGHVSAEQIRTPTGGSSVSTLTLRIPGDQYEDALADLAELGERSSLERSVEDVTEEFADTESRITSSEAALETLRGYLDEAESVDELLEVESHIQERQEELEAFQARLETLEDQTAYSTVSLTLQSVHGPRDDIDTDEPQGFLGGLESGAHALLTMGKGLLTLVGWLLPFAVAVIVIGAGPWLWWRSRRSEQGAKAKEKTGNGKLRSPLSRLSRRGVPSGPKTFEPEEGDQEDRNDGP